MTEGLAKQLRLYGVDAAAVESKGKHARHLVYRSAFGFQSIAVSLQPGPPQPEPCLFAFVSSAAPVWTVYIMGMPVYIMGIDCLRHGH